MTIIVPCAQPTEFGWLASFSQGMEEPALFHVILLTAAVHIGFMTGNFKSPDAIFHKLRAIQRVNEKLRDSTAPVSDLMIHAVTFMAMCEGVGADQGAANAHLDGLSLMVEARGGLSALDYHLQQKICLAEYLCCIEPDKKPRFILPSSGQGPSFKKTTTSSLEVPLGFQDLMTIVTLDPEFVAILLDMVNFSVEFRQAHSYDFRRKLVASDYDVTSIRYRLLCMESARRSGTHKELMGDACRIGALVFVKTVFDQFGCWGPNHKVYGRPYTTLVEKLKVYLTRLDGSVDALKVEYLELSIWLTCMVGVMNLETGNRRWYNSHLSETAAKLGLRSWDEVRAVLRKFIWIEWVHELPCKELWKSVRDGRDMQGEVSPLDRCIVASVF